MIKPIRYMIALGTVALFSLGCTTILQPALQNATPSPIAEQIIVIQTEPPLDDEKATELRAILKRITFLEGITVNGIPIGGMTTEQAKAALQTTLDEQKKAFYMTVRDPRDSEAEPVVFNAESLHIKDDLDDILEEAFDLVREDTGYDSVMAEVEKIKSGKDYTITLSFDENSVKTSVDTYANAHDTPAVDATVTYNSEENKIEYVPEVSGQVVNRETLADLLLSAKNGDAIDAPFEEVKPEITLENVAEHFVLRGKMSTSFKGSNDNRKYNIRKGVGLITGTIMEPGDVFSANDTLGVRNRSNGWKMAGAYNDGSTVQEYGGGVCQLSSTLYNAAVKANLEIVYRQNHSMPVSYIDKGLDATINSVGNLIDFKFKNNSSSRIIIVGYTNGNTLTFEIYGIPLIEESNGEYDEIKVRAKKIKSLSPNGETVVEIDYSKPVGYKEKTQERREGSVYQSYKSYYLNGEQLWEEELAESIYKAFAGKIIVGPPASDDSESSSGGSGSSSHSGSSSGSESSGGSSGNESSEPVSGDSGNSSQSGNESQSGGGDNQQSNTENGNE